jgi:hypothetical protein
MNITNLFEEGGTLSIPVESISSQIYAKINDFILIFFETFSFCTPVRIGVLVGTPLPSYFCKYFAPVSAVQSVKHCLKQQST